MEKNMPLARRLKNAIAGRDLPEIISISGEIASGITFRNEEEKELVVGGLNKVQGWLNSGDTRGWNKPAGTSKERIVEVIGRALSRIKGEEVTPQIDDPAAFRRRCDTKPLKRIPSHGIRTGGSNGARVKRR